MAEVRGEARAEYAFGTEGLGFGGFEVADFHGVEEISRPYRFAVTLVRGAEQEPVDLDALVGAPATLAIGGAEEKGFFLRHGIVVEAEEIERAPAFSLYRAVLGPPLERARHRRRCRTFFDRTLESIVNQVLGEGDGLSLLASPSREEETVASFDDYTPPTVGLAWNLNDARTIARVQHPGLWSYTVQYNESDLDFVSRLLEAEGLSYFFEHTPTRLILWVSDRPGLCSVFAERPAYRIGAGEGMLTGDERCIRSLRATRRQRSRVVTMRDYDWSRPGVTLEGKAPEVAVGEAAATHFEFPAGDDELRDHPCEQPARIRAERFDVERCSADGVATVRGLPVGRRIEVRDVAGDTRGEHLLVRIETVAARIPIQSAALDDEPFGFDGRTPRTAGMFQARFVALPAAVPFRPAMSTPRPRIDGVQAATVTDRDGASVSTSEIHCDEWARVRVRFPWDQREDGHPSSKWVRVSQAWAGAGFGAMFIPRIGEEVLVAYMNGDVDEPMIVGRVYNVRNPIPTNAADEPEVSTLKTHSSPGADGNNEIRFQDLAGNEEVYLHAQKNLKEVVRADHTSNVGGIRSSTIGGDEHLVVGGSRTTSVALDVVTTVLGDAATTVGADRIHRVEGSDFLTVEENRTAELHGSETHSVTGDRSVSVSGDHSFYTLGAFHAVADEGHAFYSKGSFTSRVTEDHHFATHGTFSSDAGDRHAFQSPEVRVTSDTTELIQKKSLVARVGSTFIKITDGMITLNDGSGASLSLCGGKLVVNAASDVTIASSGEITLKSSAIHLKSGSADKDNKSFKDVEDKAKFVFRIHADELNHPHWDDTYTLKATDGSFSQSKDASDDDERHETGRSDIEFTDVPVRKKYDLTVERDGQTIVLLQDYEFEG